MGGRQAVAVADEFVPGCRRVWLDGVNAYILDTGGDGLVLIDTGSPVLFHPQRLRRAVRSSGWAITDVSDVLITHQHIDHAGGLARLAEWTNARIRVHPADAAEIEAGAKARPGIGRDAFTRLVGRAARLRRVGPAPVHVYLVDGDHLGGGIEVVHTPGHTAGHCAFLWEAHGGVLFCGDAFANWRGRLGHPPVAEDWGEAHASIRRLAELDYAVVAFGHGPVLREAARAAVAGFAAGL